MPREIRNLLDSLVEKPILSVDWDTRAIRLVHARVRSSSVTIEQVLSVVIPQDVRVDEAKSLGGFLGKAVAKAGISTKRAVVDIPRERVNFHTLKLPDASLSDLAGMVAFQIPKELHFPIDQAVVDFIVPAEKSPEGETGDVMVAAVRNEELQFYRDVFQHAGLKLQHVGLRPNANRFAVNTLLAATPCEHVLFVDVGPTTTEIDILHNGHLAFSRVADVNIPACFDTPSSVIDVDKDPQGQGLTLVTTEPAADSAFDRIVRKLMIEVTRSIEAYRSTSPGATIDRAVIGGSCDIEEALAEAIQKQYNIPAQPYNPASCFGWDADRGAAAGAFAATLGLSLSQAQSTELRFNFIAPKRAVSRAERRVKKAPMAVATAVIFVAACGVFYFQHLKPQYEERDRLRDELAATEKTLKVHKEFVTLVGAIQQYEKNRIVWVDELHELISALPEQKQIVLAGIDMSQKNHTIKLPFRGKNISTGGETATRLRDFRLPDSDQAQFEVTLGDASVKDGQKYPHNGRLQVNIVDRKWPQDAKKKRRRR